ncbi:MAG: hypothetical protein QM610_15235 [Chitinophagaceae bacterium]
MYKKGWVGIALFCVVVIVGCRCNNGHQDRGSRDSLADTTDVVETTDSFSMETIKQKDSASIFQNNTLSNALTKRDIHKDAWTNAQLLTIDTVEAASASENVKIDNAFLKKYGKLLKAAPDGQHLLDLGADNTVEDPATGKLVEGDPETNITVLDRQTGGKWTLAQLGASGEVLQVHWLDNDNVAVLCSLPGVNPKKDDTYLYVYNVKEQVRKIYQWK